MKLSFYIILSLLSVRCLAQYPTDIHFQGYLGDDRMIGKQVWQTFTDSRGFLWISGTNGLYRFDGVGLKEYRHRVDDSTSIPSNGTMYFAEDAQQRIWITSFAGLCYYNPRTDKFTTIPSAVYNMLIATPMFLCMAKDQRLWFGDGRWLVSLDTRTMHTKTYSVFDPEDSLSVEGGSVIIEDKEGKLWVACNDALYHFDPATSMSTYYSLGNTPENHKRTGPVVDMLLDNGFIWISSSQTGFSRFNIKDRTIRHYSATTNPNELYSMTDIEPVNGDTLHRYLWVATKRLGLAVFDKLEGRFVRFFRSEDKRSGALSFNNCSTLQEDGQGILWVATERGLNKYDRNSQKITSVFPPQYFSDVDWSHSMRFFIPSTADPWIGLLFTHGDGYYRYDFVHSRVLSAFRVSKDRTDVAEDFIDWAFRDSRGRVWCATHTVMKLLQENGKFVRSFNSVWNGEKELPARFDFEGAEDKQGRVWKTTTEGLAIFSESRQRFELANLHFRDLPDSLLLDRYDEITVARNGELWLSSRNKGGIVILDVVGRKARLIEKLEDPVKKKRLGIVNHIVLSGPYVWMAEASSVWRYDTSTGQATMYNEADGIADDQLTDLLIDKTGKIWVATYRGISVWDEQKQRFISFNMKHGLAEEVANSLFLLPDGRIMISGLGRYSVVDPANIRSNPNQYPIVITSAKINDREIIPFAQPGIIHLDYDQNVLSFDYRLLNYSNSLDNTYRYQLVGFDKDWVNAGTRTSAFYTNLPPGHYTFRVMGANSDGIWSETTAQIQFDIATPWWQTWWFKGLAIAAVVALAYYLYRLRLQKALAIERTRLRIARDLHDDVGSALSSIYMMNTVATKKIETDPDTARRMSEKAGNTSLDMMNTMSDIIWSINPVNDNMQQMIHRMREFAINTLEAKGINCVFTTDKKIEDSRLSMELRHDLYLVFKELVNNAAKYSGAQNCNIELQYTDGQLQLAVSDDGHGFDQTLPHKGNGLNNIKKRCENMQAEHRLYTKEGEGTVWVIILKKQAKLIS
jgi:signal transduction histidine kinase/ligand-binding sensor domain-containing protein